jgi:hypothetical protein
LPENIAQAAKLFMSVELVEGAMALSVTHKRRRDEDSGFHKNSYSVEQALALVTL